MSWPRQLRRVAPALDVRDLGRRERDDAAVRIVPIGHVEVVEIAPGGAEDDRVPGWHGWSLPLGRVSLADAPGSESQAHQRDRPPPGMRRPQDRARDPDPGRGPERGPPERLDD